MKNELKIIGRATLCDFPDLGIVGAPSKIDTGADVSSLWAQSATETKDGLSCVFFGPTSKFYTGETILFNTGEYTVTRVANSFGQKEIRYKVKLRIRIESKLIHATFTLSKRSNKTYPVLIGRKLLKNKFVVDVARGDPLYREEKAKRKKLELELEELGGKLKEVS